MSDVPYIFVNIILYTIILLSESPVVKTQRSVFGLLGMTNYALGRTVSRIGTKGVFFVKKNGFGTIQAAFLCTFYSNGAYGITIP